MTVRKQVLHAALAASAVLCVSVVGAQAQSLQDFVNHHQMLEREAQACQMQFQRYTQQAQYNAWHGGMTFVQPPPCVNEGPRITAQMAYDETQIRRMHNLPTNYCDTGVCGSLPNIQSGRGPGGPGPGPGPSAQGQFNQMMQGYETTEQGNEMQIGPNGHYHFDCGPNARNVTGQSYQLPNPNCVRR